MKEDWTYKKLGDLCSIATGKRDANHAKEDGLYRFYTCAAQYIHCNTYTFDGDCLILPGNGANVGEVYKYSGKFDAYQRTYVLSKIRKEEILFDYLYFYFLSKWKKQGSAKQYGAATNYILMGNFTGFTIAYPSLSEQQRIVSRLDSAFAHIDELKANEEKQLSEARTLFQKALTKAMEPKEGWEEKKLPDISENLDSMRKPVTKKDRTEGIYPYYGASGIVDYVDDYIFDEDLLCISEDGANLLMRTYPIAFPISGKVWVNNHAHVLRFKSIVTQKYVEYYFAGIKLDEYITGAAQPKLTQKALNNIVINIPDSEDEQQRIVSRLDSLSAHIRELEEVLQKTIAECDALKQALLRKVFE